MRIYSFLFNYVDIENYMALVYVDRVGYITISSIISEDRIEHVSFLVRRYYDSFMDVN